MNLEILIHCNYCKIEILNAVITTQKAVLKILRLLQEKSRKQSVILNTEYPNHFRSAFYNLKK